MVINKSAFYYNPFRKIFYRAFISLLKAISIPVGIAVKYIHSDSKRTELSLIMSRLIGNFSSHICIRPLLPAKTDQTSPSIKYHQSILPAMKFRVLYLAIVRNSERSEENWPLYKLVKQKAIPQL